MSAGLLLLLLLVFSAPLVGIAGLYNRLVGLRNATRNAHARLDAAERELDQAIEALRAPLAAAGLPSVRTASIAELAVSRDELTAQLAFARRGFNDAVWDYNRAQAGLLRGLLAVILRFHPAWPLNAASTDPGCACPPAVSC